MATLKRNDLIAKLNENPNQIFSMLYQKTNGEMRKAVCLLHVSNPKHTLVPGTGKYKGMSAEDALKYHNNIKYFDLTVDGVPTEGQTPGKGDYRSAKIDRIKEVTVKGVTYTLVD